MHFKNVVEFFKCMDYTGDAKIFRWGATIFLGWGGG